MSITTVANLKWINCHLKAVPAASIVEGLKAKQYDLALSMPTDTYPTYKDADGYQILGRPEQSLYVYWI